MLFKLHWGGRGVKGEAWRKLLDEDFRPRLERMWREQDYLHPRALLGYFPCYSEGNDIVVLDPEDRETVLERLVCPRQPKGDRLCLADFFRPKDSGELDVVALQAVTAGDEVTELMASSRPTASSPSSSSCTASACRPPRAWPSGCTGACATTSASRRRRAAATRGATRRCPDQSEHEKVYRLLDATERIGLRLSGGYAVEPEQSTLALVAHHPQAIYFGTTTAACCPRAQGRADDVIKGSPRDPCAVRRARRHRAGARGRRAGQPHTRRR